MIYSEIKFDYAIIIEYLKLLLTESHLKIDSVFL